MKIKIYMYEDVDKSSQPFFADSGHVLVTSDEMVGLLESSPFVSFFGMEPGGRCRHEFLVGFYHSGHMSLSAADLHCLAVPSLIIFDPNRPVFIY